MATIRTAIIHNIVTPYRNVLFDVLSEHSDIDLHVFYCSKSHKKRNWNVPNELDHEHTFLPGLKVDRSDIQYHINPTIVSELAGKKFDATVIGGCTNLTMQLGYIISKIDCSGTVLWTERIRPPNGHLRRLVDPVLRAMTNNADSVIVPTSRAKQFQESRGVGLEKLFVASNIIDNEDYWDEAGPELPVRVLFVGQLVERKGVSYLLEAYESVHNDNIELIIVGDGPQFEDYQQLARRRNLDVTFTGWVSEERKREEFAKADLFILPSLEDLAPLVLNEALASGLPILTTKGVGNASDMIIEGGNGAVVPTADSDTLAEKLSALVADPEELRKMGRRSKRIVDERFSPTVASNRFADAIKSSVID